MTDTALQSRVAIDEVRDRLRKQAYLYESPADFRAGVEAAVNAFLREVAATTTASVAASIDDIDFV